MGRRVSYKRSDRRWEDDDGNVWASRLECEVFETLSGDDNIVVRRCIKGGADTFAYHSKVLRGSCMECGSTKIVQKRTYTPDLYVLPAQRTDDTRGYYLEIKGYFPGPQRKLFSDFQRTGPDIDLRIVFEGDGKATPRLSYTEYTRSRLKIECHVWDGVLPRYWNEKKSDP